MASGRSRSAGWQVQEDRIAKQIGGSVNAGSGAFDRKGDVRNAEIVVEAKWTGKKQVTIQAEVLEKICGEALAVNRMPVLQVEVNDRCYGVLEWDDVLMLLDLMP